MNKQKYEVIVDFGSKYFQVEAKNEEEAQAQVNQMIEQDKDFNYNEEWWIANIEEVEE